MKLFQRWRDKRAMKNALMLLWRMDLHMRRSKWTQKQRKQFWSDFIKSPASRGIAFQQVLHSMRNPLTPHSRESGETRKKKLRSKG